MKKFVALVLALLMVFALTACGKTAPAATPAPTAEPTVEPTAEPTPEPVAEEPVVEEPAAEAAESGETAEEPEAAAEPATETPAENGDMVEAPEEAAAEELAVMSYAEFVAAELDSPVKVETYVQAKQSWWDNKATVYTQDEDGAYFLYEMPCTEEEYELLVPGTKIRVTGFKSEWSGEVEITDASFEILEAEPFIAEAVDVTELLGTEELIEKQNQLVAFKGMTVEAYDESGAAFAYKNPEDKTDDLYFKVSLNGETYEFCVEYYLCNEETEVYQAVQALNVGDVIDLEGFLYWYNGANPHITSVMPAAEATMAEEAVAAETAAEEAGAAEETMTEETEAVEETMTETVETAAEEVSVLAAAAAEAGETAEEAVAEKVEEAEEAEEAMTVTAEESEEAMTEAAEAVEEAVAEKVEEAEEAMAEAVEEAEESVTEAAEAVEEAMTEEASEEEESGVMSYAEFVEAELDTEVTVETYVQAKQSWWDNKAKVYTQDEDGAYFLYDMPCTEEEYELLVPGTKIRVTGFKSEWSGEVEITDASFEILEAEPFIAEAVDVTELLGTEELIEKQNQLVAFKGMTVEAYDESGAAFAYKNPEDKTDDLYFKVSLNGETYEFCVEYYLCNEETEVYQAVQALNVGDVIDLEGFLYWYNGANPHIISVMPAAEG